MKAIASALVIVCACASGAAFSTAAEVAAVNVGGIVVPTRALYPGDELTADALEQQPSRVPGAKLPGIIQNVEDAVGKIARRTLLKGQAIPAGAVREKAVVLQGRTYALVYQSEFLSITASGVAMKSGAAGEIISVRNADTGITVRAKVGAEQVLYVEAQ